ncbi:MAG: amidohydrolase [Alphaproteobacteria bacterium]
MESHAPFPKAPPRFRPPPGTTDCHLHIFGPYARYPLQPNRSFTPPEASLANYERLMKTLGIERCVVVQPSVYGTDNSCTEDAVERLGPISRGVAVLGPDVEEATLKRLDRVGFRGVRLNLLFRGGVPIEAMEPLAKRLAPYGWHIQLLLDARTLPDLAPRLRALPVEIVIDHMGYMPVSVGMNSPAVDTMRRLLGEGRTWVKLSGSYAVTVDGPPYVDAASLARTLLEAAPERCVWGTDWPHPAAKGTMPDDSELLDLVPTWTTDAALQRKLFRDNPAALYGFDGK